MELNKTFIDGLWSKEINVSDFVSKNITPYTGDASFLQGPTERTKRVWDICLKALEEERKTTVSAPWTMPQYPPSLHTRPATSTVRTNSSSDCRPTNC